MSDWLKAAGAAAGSVTAAGVSALCCAGPILAAGLGISGAGFGATFEPLRPYLVAATVLLLGLGFYWVYSTPAEACLVREGCKSLEDAHERRQPQKAMLWAATALAGALATFPTCAGWIT